MKTGHPLEQSMQGEQMREALNCTGARQQPAIQTRSTIFTMRMRSAIIPNRENEFADGAICRLCEITIPVSRRASTSARFMESATYGSRNIRSTITGN
jgi:hypothetical protein